MENYMKFKIFSLISIPFLMSFLASAMQPAWQPTPVKSAVMPATSNIVTVYLKSSKTQMPTLFRLQYDVHNKMSLPGNLIGNMSQMVTIHGYKKAFKVPVQERILQFVLDIVKLEIGTTAIIKSIYGNAAELDQKMNAQITAKLKACNQNDLIDIYYAAKILDIPSITQNLTKLCQKRTV